MAKSLEICPKRLIGSDNPCFIIAEVGQNHQGDMEIAKHLILKAKESGADCVKFQKSDLATKFNAASLARPYLSENSWGETYGTHKSHLEFSESQFRQLQQYSQEIGIPFTASAMDEVSLQFLHSLNVPFIKIGSGDANNYQLLRSAAATGRPIVLSTGMQSMEGVRKAVQCVLEAQAGGDARLCVLQCTSSYPTPPSHVNLRVMRTYAQEFPGVHIGYSGHEEGYAISLAAAALGAKVIERHITFDKNAKGSDHKCSLEPEEFCRLVSGVREIEAALGTGVKEILAAEEPVIKKLGKTLVSTQDLAPGTIIQREHLVAKVAEPRGINAELVDCVVGQELLRFIKKDESLLSTDFKTSFHD
ncbi:sialic acid synthase [Ischnura elegans]|uniref:sialic acid synthase n=1 Tax=Ischnura elegans TaxID=197161 RepID=UPI001ED8900D|nr:sialic acid synthase [Ischnura elegans]XP_046385237.1 sialic acid synthase [Ischnura elegans]XP_046385238.1 sialic acid synthase [Ischnura elegans]XP_046385239.1 sialic acid synthase [Ischnura elegans]